MGGVSSGELSSRICPTAEPAVKIAGRMLGCTATVDPLNSSLIFILLFTSWFSSGTNSARVGLPSYRFPPRDVSTLSVILGGSSFSSGSRRGPDSSEHGGRLLR